MEYILKLVGLRPTEGDLVLKAETPLSGRTFVATAASCLRRSLDHVDRYRHQTMGALATYEMHVPDRIAEDSGRFDDKSSYILLCENDILSHYIFYTASVSYAQTGRPCYPYIKNETTLISLIDELGFLSDWAACGFPAYVIWRNDSLGSGAVSCIDCDNNSSLNYDESRCEGCSACAERNDPKSLWPEGMDDGGKPPCPPGPGPEPPPGPHLEPPIMCPHQPPRKPAHRKSKDGKFRPMPEPRVGTIAIGNTYYSPVGKKNPYIG